MGAPWLHLLLPPLLSESLLHSYTGGRFSSQFDGRHSKEVCFCYSFTWGCDLLSSFSSSWLFKRMSSVTFQVYLETHFLKCNSKGADVMKTTVHHLQEPFSDLVIAFGHSAQAELVNGPHRNPGHSCKDTEFSSPRQQGSLSSQHIFQSIASESVSYWRYVAMWLICCYKSPIIYCPTVWIVAVWLCSCECCSSRCLVWSCRMHKMDYNQSLPFSQLQSVLSCLFAFNCRPLWCKTGNRMTCASFNTNTRTL